MLRRCMLSISARAQARVLSVSPVRPARCARTHALLLTPVTAPRHKLDRVSCDQCIRIQRHTTHDNIWHPITRQSNNPPANIPSLSSFLLPSLPSRSTPSLSFPLRQSTVHVQSSAPCRHLSISTIPFLRLSSASLICLSPLRPFLFFYCLYYLVLSSLQTTAPAPI
ncbi:hypothetical protein GGS23DRAFT_429843 [Durotheca rogersii]|uniref:uncharacterized protein n=1 Tax=Durotheca rogersii TaxID=419775 RepID=UPI00221E41A3|nr:uncharacterized protein GGS23DRAFT_429843 [Durotheca rogersii]KAI5865501.1 hypothetical protein GGS23DRAFT_429843 [Durotheca rogersii]